MPYLYEMFVSGALPFPRRCLFFQGSLGITVQEVHRGILVGAFGSFLNPESACWIGLPPGNLAGGITAVGQNGPHFRGPSRGVWLFVSNNQGL